MSSERRVVTEIRSHGRGSKRRTIWLDDEPWRSMAEDVLRELAIRVGDALDTAAVDAKALEAERRLARERVLRLLSYKERSEAEIGSRLLDDGYPQCVVDETVTALSDTGLVDDVRFAEGYARSLVELRGLGRARAMRDMVRRGIPSDLAAAALDALAPSDSEPERALKEAARLLRPGESPQRLAGRLVRRGFSTSQALSAALETASAPPGSGDWDGQ